MKPCRLRLLAFLAIFVGQWGCALRVEAPPTWERIKMDPGTIGVVTARFDPKVVMPRLEVGTSDMILDKGTQGVTGALVGSGVGVIQGFFLSLLSCIPTVALGGPVTYGACLGVGVASGAGIGAGLGGSMGAAAGSASPHPPLTEKEAQALASNVERTIASFPLQEGLCDQLMMAAAAEKKIDRRFVSIASGGAAKPDEETTYGVLKTEGIDTVLELSVTSLGLRNGRVKSAYTVLEPFVAVRIRLVRVAGDHVLLTRTYEYRGIKRAAIDWAATEPWQRLLNEAPSWLGREIVDDLFLESPQLAEDESRHSEFLGLTTGWRKTLRASQPWR